MNAKRMSTAKTAENMAHVFTRGTAAFAYTGAMRHSVYRMKAENRRDYLDFYADAMAQALEPYLMRWQPERIIGVPMHWQKKWKRGYNQSELLAKKLAERTEIQIEGSWVSCMQKDESAENVEPKRTGKKSIRLLYTSEAGKMLSAVY